MAQHDFALTSQSDVQLPDTGKSAFFFDSADGFPKFKDDLGTVKTFPASTSHHQLADLTNYDDHTQYFNQARGDARYASLNVESTGLLTGGILSINWSDPTKFDLTAWVWVIVDNSTNTLNPTKQVIAWSNFTSQINMYIANKSTTYIWIDSSGHIYQSPNEFTEEERRSIIELWWLDSPDGVSISLAYTEPRFNADALAQFNDFLQTYWPLNILGNSYFPNTDLTIHRNSGTIFEHWINYVNNKANPNILSISWENPTQIQYYYRDGLWEWINDLALVTNIDPNHYDDGTGTLHAVTVWHWTIQPISFYPVGIYNDIQYGQAEYATLNDAKAAVSLSIVSNPFNSVDILRWWIIVQQGTTNLSNPASCFFVRTDTLTMSDLASWWNIYIWGTTYVTNDWTNWVWLFWEKINQDLKFKNINNASSKLSVTDNLVNHTIDLDIWTLNLNDLSDVVSPTPNVNDSLIWNGLEWTNAPQWAVAVGNGVTYFLDDTVAKPAGVWPQTIDMETLALVPSGDAEAVETVTVNNNTVMIDQYIDWALLANQINAGIWTFNTYCSVDDISGTSQIVTSMFKNTIQAGTLTITGTGTSRTATVTGWTPFVAGDYNANITLTGSIQTPNWVFPIIGYTSSSVITIWTLSTYTNETSVLYTLDRYLFQSFSTEIDTTIPTLFSITSAQPTFPISTTDKLVARYYATTTNIRNINVTLYHNGVLHYTNIKTPLITKHNDLDGLQGWNSTERYHLSASAATIVWNTSWTNTWDETQSTIKTKLGSASSGIDWYLLGTDWTTFNNKQSALGFTAVPNTRQVNGHALSTDISITKWDVGLWNVANTDTTTTANITDSTNKRFITDAQQTVLGTTSWTNTWDETASRIATINHGTSAKTVLVDADEITGQNSASSFSLIRTTWTDVKSFLKTYNDTLYLPLAWGTMTGTITTRTSTTSAGTSPIKIPVASALMTAAENGAIESDGKSLYYTDSWTIRQQLTEGAYWDMYENNTWGTALTITTTGTYYGWTTATSNLTLLTTFLNNTAIASGTVDQIQISTGWDGIYEIKWDVNCTLSGVASTITAFVYKNNAQTNIEAYINATVTGAQTVLNFSWLLSLAATDVIDLRFTCGASGRTLTFYKVRLIAKRIAR